MTFEIDEKRGIERSLQLKDHIEWQDVLRHQLLLAQEAFKSMDSRIINSSIVALQAQIPSTWHDEKFKQDLKDSEKELVFDIRPLCCGIKLSVEYCQAKGIPTSRKQKIIDPVKRLHALINLLDRKGYTTGRQYTEENLGIPFKEYIKVMSERHVLEED